ncbi:SGNH hydrolase-type esterase domain containing protein [Hyaloscypha variabilis]
MQKLSTLLPVLLASLAHLSTTLSTPLVQTEKLDQRLVQSYFTLSSIGDSWAAGQATIPRDAYGGPGKWTKCFQHARSWEALMAGDNSWTNDPIAFKFAACSGSHLVDAVHGKNQISQVGRPDLLTMQMGGNDAGFGKILIACIYIGDVTGSQKDYPNPDGTCFKTITEWEAYIDAPPSAGAGKSFYFDHHLTLQDILGTDLIKNRDDFYLAVVGYGEFFNTKSPDSDWCNDQSFGTLKAPKLSNVLRTKVNALAVKLNAVIAQSTSDLKNDHVKFYDPSSLFENHRFCEPGHTLNNQYFLKDVWFWNMSPPEDDPNYAAFSATDAHETAWAQNYIFINGTKASQAQLLGLIDPTGGNPYDSWSGRSFHPKDGGHFASKHSSTAKITPLILKHAKEQPADFPVI